MIVAIHQPNFLPWIGYFEKLLRSDIFVLLDDVQYSKNSFTNRVKLNIADVSRWITVPVRHNSETKICDVKIVANNIWKRKLLSTIQFNYTRAPYTSKYLPNLSSIIQDDISSLSNMNMHLIQWCAEQLGASTEIIRSSDLRIDEVCDGAERIHKILKKLNASAYLSGEGGGAKRYLDVEFYKKESIEIVQQDFRHPVYQQQSSEFIENLSIIDLLFNCGQQSRAIILG